MRARINEDDYVYTFRAHYAAPPDCISEPPLNPHLFEETASVAVSEFLLDPI